MADARDVARLLSAVGFDPSAPEESVLICPLRLQKMLYYCQGWALALLGRPLFRQPLEAWDKGPVVRDVYGMFAGRKDVIAPEPEWLAGAGLSETEAALVRAVWQEYVRYTPGQLVGMTHREPAWCEARAGTPPGEPSSAPLSVERMGEYFREQARARAVRDPKFPELDPVSEWQRADAWERAGKPSVGADELFGELLAGTEG